MRFIRTDNLAKRVIVVIFTVILAPSISRRCWAESFRSPISSLECPEVEFEPAHPGSSLGASRDSKSVELSYPVAATQLLDFYKKSVSDPQEVQNPSSVIVLALESQAATNSVERALHTAQKNGTCAESLRLQKGLERDLVDRPDQFISELQSFLSKNPNEFDLAQIFSKQTGGSDPLARSECVSCGATQASLESNAMKLILNSAPWLDRKRAILKILESTAQMCTGANRNSFKALPNPTVKPIANTAELYSIIQDRFGSGSPLKKQPLALSICKPVLEKGRNYSGVERSLDRQQAATPSDHCSSPKDSLAVTIYGSRRDSRTGNCELKIKSPWGQTCKGYSSEWLCKNGNLWMDIETLGRNSFKAVYLNP
ncbi:MAG: hypothetical protein ABI041_02970 [Bdellovibrionia bacterium]